MPNAICIAGLETTAPRECPKLLANYGYFTVNARIRAVWLAKLWIGGRDGLKRRLIDTRNHAIGARHVAAILVAEGLRHQPLLAPDSEKEQRAEAEQAGRSRDPI